MGKPAVEDTYYRRKCIAEIVNGVDGFKGIVPLQTELKKRFGIDVSRPTLYQDMRQLTSITNSKVGSIDNAVMNFIQSELDKMRNLSKNAERDSDKIAAANAVFTGIKTMYQMLAHIYQRDPSGVGPEGAKNVTPVINVIFSDEVVKVDKENDG